MQQQLESELIEGCKQKQHKAFKMLYKQYGPTLLAICYRYCKSRSEAEDVLQEGFIKIFKKIDSYKGKGSFEGWIKRIIVNTAINHFRSNLKHYYLYDLDDDKIFIDEADDIFEFKIEIDKGFLIKCIQELPQGYKLVFNMYAIDGLAHSEIAKLLGISINTSKSQLFKARRQLKGKIQAHLDLNK